jgi:ATP-dependent Clp protease ATP-binding subunit ClpA
MHSDTNSSFTIDALRAIQLSAKRARQFYHDFVQPIHVLLGILESGGNANAILNHLGCDCQHLYEEVVNYCRDMPFEYYVIMGGPLPQTKEVRAIWDRANLECGRRKASVITTADVLLALANSADNPAADFLRKSRITSAYIADHLWVVAGARRIESNGQICEHGGNAVCAAEADAIAGERETSFWKLSPRAG